MTDWLQSAIIARAAELGLTAYAIAKATDGAVSEDHVRAYLTRSKSMGSHKLQHVLTALGLTIKPTKPAISGVWVNPQSEAMLNMMIPPKQGTDKMARVMSEMPEWPWSQEYGAKPSPDATTPKRV